MARDVVYNKGMIFVCKVRHLELTGGSRSVSEQDLWTREGGGGCVTTCRSVLDMEVHHTCITYVCGHRSCCVCICECCNIVGLSVKKEGGIFPSADPSNRGISLC